MGNMYTSLYGLVLEGIMADLELEEDEAGYLANDGGTRIRNRHRDRGYALREVTHLTDGQFKTMFRMSRESFEKLLALIDPFLREADLVMARNSSGSGISNRTKLYITLRWLAGGSYIDLIFAWGISKSAFYSADESGVVWPVIEAINAVFVIGLPVHDRIELMRMADEFSQFSKGEMWGCVTAIDGWVARTRQPFSWEVQDVKAYYNRHGFFGLVVLAGCDARCRFTMFSCKNTGSTNDVIAWELSQLSTAIGEGLLPEEFYLIGDEAFINTDQFLVPYSGRGIGVWKDSFNFHLSVMRQCIERSFAYLVNRWGILWRPIKCSFWRWSLLLTVLAKLHNFCVDESESIPSHRFPEDIEENDMDDILMNRQDINEEDYIRSRTYFRANRRTGFTMDLQEKGVRRPNYAAMNSRA
jgi:hypothetical protein